jgi:magnesium-transporting ATPase (P-type)
MPAGVVNLDLNMITSLKEKTLRHMAQSALRTIALAYKDISYAEYQKCLGEEDGREHESISSSSSGKESQHGPSNKKQEEEAPNKEGG